MLDLPVAVIFPAPFTCSLPDTSRSMAFDASDVAECVSTPAMVTVPVTVHAPLSNTMLPAGTVTSPVYAVAMVVPSVRVMSWAAMPEVGARMVCYYRFSVVVDVER